MKQKRIDRTKGIFPLAATIVGVTIVGVLGLPFVVENSNQLFHNKVYRNFKNIEHYYDKNHDGNLSLKEKYFMYSDFNMQSKPADYLPNVQDMKKIIEEYNELDKAQFGIFDSIPPKSLEDSVHFKTLEDSL